MAAVTAPSQPIKYYYHGDREVEEECQLKSYHFQLSDRGVATITANVPEKLNSWSQNMIFEMLLVLEHCQRDAKVKCLLWTGAGRAFSSGADFVDNILKHDEEIVRGYQKFGRAHMPTSGAKAGDMALKGLVILMLELEKPSVCAINGLTVGGAVNFGLLLHDFVLCSSEAKFKYPFTSLGLTPEVSSSFVLPALVGMPTAKRWIMLGDWFSAQEAKDAGLLHSIEAAAELMPKALALSERLAASSETIGLQKRVMHGNTWFRMKEAMDHENTVIGDATQSDGYRTAMMSFTKKFSKAEPQAKL